MTIFEDPLSLAIAGVGGQGIIRMGRIIGEILLKKGYFVTMMNDIGAAQRSGSVTSNIRISKKRRCGPMIPEGHAHFILGLEPLETLRMLSKYGTPKTPTLSNLRPISPAGVLLGRDKYPDLRKLREAIEALSGKDWFIDATGIALKLGAVIITNIVMLGALAAIKQLPLSKQDIEGEIRETFPPKRVELNLKALDMGFNALRR